MAIVIDASAALSFLAPSQTTKSSEGFRNGVAATEGLAAPFVFRLEMRHALVRLERRLLVSAAALDVELAAFEAVIEIAPASEDGDFARLVSLARIEALGLYDAAYIDLALARGERLASRDAALLGAASRRGVEVHDLR